MRTHHKTCNLCEATCGVLIDVEGERVEAIRPDMDDPFSRGHICPKAFALKEIHEDPDRLKRPLRRRGSDWEEISWEDALDEATTRLCAIQRAHGRNAVASYMGNPTVHNLGSLLYLQPLLGALHSRNKYSASSVDQNPKHASSLFLFGNIFSIPVPDVDRTDFLLILGANPLVSNGSLMTAPDIATRLRAIRKRGGKIVVVDPRRTETAKLADEHLFIRPGQDALLLAALLQVVFAESLVRQSPALAKSTGVQWLQEQVQPFAPEAVAAPLGMEAAKIRDLAREFAAAPSAACYGRIGTCLHEFGTLSSWLVDALNLVTGNLDREGGAMFTQPAADLRSLMARAGKKGHLDAYRSRVRGAAEFNGELPVACLAEEILTPGEGQVRGLLTLAGNPTLSTPNGAQLEKALAGLEYYVAVDIYVNETTRHAHLILPPAWSLEQDNYELAFHVLAIRNTAKFSPRVFAPGKDMREDWRILGELALRIEEQKQKNPLRRGLLGLARRANLLPQPRTVLDLMLRLGPYGDKYLPWKKGLSVRRLQETPQGVDLGPLRPCLDEVLQSKDGRIGLNHPVIGSELTRLGAYLKESVRAPSNGDLLLIGRRELRTNNSWGHNAPILAKGAGRCALLMNPRDAERLALESGQPVRVKSRVGEVVTDLKVSQEMAPGVVSLPHGWGHHRPGTRMEVAREHPGVSVNDLTDERLIEPVVGNAILNGVPVTVSAA